MKRGIPPTVIGVGIGIGIVFLLTWPMLLRLDTDTDSDTDPGSLKPYDVSDFQRIDLHNYFCAFYLHKSLQHRPGRIVQCISLLRFQKQLYAAVMLF